MSTMITPGQLSSRWIVDFEKQVVRGKHVLLYGNIHDQFLWRGTYATPMDFLMAYFGEKQFEIVVRYDPIDGLAFGVEAMRPKFDELVRRRVQGSGPGVSGEDNPAPAPQPVPANPLAPPPRRRPSEVAGAQPQSLRLDEVIARLRIVLGQNEVPVVAIFDIADMLTSDPARYTPDERNALMLMKKCLLEAALIRQGPLTGYRNTLIITAGELNRVPEWLYRENPFVSIVQAARPNTDERKQFIMSFGQYFYGGDTVTEIEIVADEFANLTEGFQAWDLEALRRTSHAERWSLVETRRLIDFFKFGIREDPWERLSRERVSQANEILSRRVIGQPHAVQAVTTMLTTARVGLGFQDSSGKSSQPKGVFFFVGPTGVGKTELAKAVTELVFSDERAFERFDMSEYKEEHAAEKLTGSPPGFIGYEEGGRLTNRMLERPHSILLFDEIEKAHPRVLDKFLQILEDGRLTDGKGQTAYFNQAAIIFTSNIGASELMDSAHRNMAEFSYEQVADHFRQQVQDYFVKKIGRAELLNRLGENIIAFDMLRPEFIRPIGVKFFAQLTAAAQQKYGVTLVADDLTLWPYLETRMQNGENLLLGGRRVKTLLLTLLVDPLNRWIFTNISDPSSLTAQTLRLGVTSEGELEVTCLSLT